MLSIFLTTVITFFIASLFGYVAHRSFHSKLTGRFHDAHMTHHIKLYPADNYISDKYRSAGKDNTVKFFGIVGLPLVIAPIVLGALHILPLSLVITALTVMAITSFLHSYLHDAFHIKNHWLYRVPLFRILFAHWVEIHWLHHIDMTKNFGVFVFHWDHLFRTFWSTK